MCSVWMVLAEAWRNAKPVCSNVVQVEGMEWGQRVCKALYTHPQAHQPTSQARRTAAYRPRCARSGTYSEQFCHVHSAHTCAKLLLLCLQTAPLTPSPYTTYIFLRSARILCLTHAPFGPNVSVVNFDVVFVRCVESDLALY